MQVYPPFSLRFNHPSLIFLFIARSFRYESFSADKVIFKQHAPGDRFYLIIEGRCSISILTEQEDGSFVDKEVHVCKAGDYFGERALQYDETRAATVRSIELMECLSLSKEVYSEILKVSHLISCYLYR